MMHQLGVPEILAPAGEWASLHAALSSGANAIYVGVGELNMRQSATNFELGDLKALVRRCHHRDCRLYLALNTMVYDREFTRLETVLTAAAAAGVDAVIASDPALMEAAVQRGLDVHVSTQVSVSNARSILFYHRHVGVRRFVLARECTLEDMAAIRRQLAVADAAAAAEVEFEVFAHGAMCVAVSGRCFLSQFQYGRSANRGDCMQPCRREYRVQATDEAMAFALGTDTVMSPQDLCTLPFLEQLIEAGVASLKIEGRGRSPEYAAIVTQAYREVAQAYCLRRHEEGFETYYAELKAKHLARMKRVFHRGFSSGFYMGKPLEAWARTNGSLAEAHKEYAGIVTNYYRDAGAAEICMHGHPLRVGDTLYIIGATTGVLEQRVGSMQAEHKSIEVAEKGMAVAILTERKVRRKDKVYVVVEHRADGDV